jgi:hypothetical protein
MERDLILGEEESEIDLIELMNSQLDVLTYVSDLDSSLYDLLPQDKIKVITKALNVIYKIQVKILKDL